MARRHSLLLVVAFGCASPASRAPDTTTTGETVERAPPPPSSPSKGEKTSNGVQPRPPKMRPVPYDDCRGGGELDVPIVVHDEAEVVRDPPLTGFVIPMAEGADIRSLRGLGVFDEAGRRLPSQLEVLSRWGGAHPSDCDHPIRFAYARVSATPGPGRRVTWHVRKADGGEMSPLVLQTREKAWVIDTGVARFTVRRDRFDGLSKVELPDGRGGYEVVSELKPATGGSSFFVDHGGLKRTSDASTWKLELELAGPQVVTVLARGYYPGDGPARQEGPNRRRGLGFTVRLHFYARSSIVRVEHTYYYGQVEGWGAGNLTNTTVVKRAWMTVPLSRPPKKIYVRADDEIHTLDPKKVVQVEQVKRSPERPAVQYAVFSGEKTVETGEWARRPFMAAVTDRHYVLATIARMSERDPQGFTWSNQLGSVDLDFTSAPIQIGAARGIWSVAALDFGRGTPNEARVQALQRFAERPLLGTPAPAYVNGTKTIGPYAPTTDGPAGDYADLVERVHSNTVSYLERIRITGLQIWPDLPARSCEIDYNCGDWAGAYYGGGDNNYWNWSKVGFDEFFRTGRNDYVYDFSLGEAITYVETLAVRPDHHHIGDSSVAGLAPCYGDATGYDGVFIEGTNNRRDRCPADYGYDKTLKHAFLATGDHRFIDFFEEAGTAVVNIFGAPPPVPQPYLELNLSRLSEQRLELLSNGAEFGRDEKTSALLRKKLRRYVDHMLGKTLVNGHACEVGGTGKHDVTKTKECNSQVGWMMPVGMEWSIRTARILGHEGLRAWVMKHARVSAKNHAFAGSDGKPATGRLRDWRVGYTCKVDGRGRFSKCTPWAEGSENDSRFYNNGLLAYLNVFGLILSEDSSDPNGICDWLPSTYERHINDLGFGDLNGFIWGKQSGQALALAGEAVGAISRCK